MLCCVHTGAALGSKLGAELGAAFDVKVGYKLGKLLGDPDDRLIITTKARSFVYKPDTISPRTILLAPSNTLLILV